MHTVDLEIPGHDKGMKFTSIIYVVQIYLGVVSHVEEPLSFTSQPTRQMSAPALLKPRLRQIDRTPCVTPALCDHLPTVTQWSARRFESVLLVLYIGKIAQY